MAVVPDLFTVHHIGQYPRCSWCGLEEEGDPASCVIFTSLVRLLISTSSQWHIILATVDRFDFEKEPSLYQDKRSEKLANVHCERHSPPDCS